MIEVIFTVLHVAGLAMAKTEGSSLVIGKVNMRRQDDTDTYRVFWINEAGSVDAASWPIAISDDATAVDEAKLLADGDHVEVWRGASLVARINEPAVNQAA